MYIILGKSGYIAEAIIDDNPVLIRIVLEKR